LLRYITALCRRPEIAQEIVQEAFLRYYVFRLRTEIQQGAVTWLYKTARNCTFDYFDEYFSKNAVDLDEALDCADVRQNHADEYERADLTRRAQEVLTPRDCNVSSSGRKD
jgi:DNA-directed RNA polymerase specialized sigma24 family protein